MSDLSTTPPGLPDIPQTELIKWPKVLGILGIIFSILGILTAVFTLFTPQFTMAMMKLSSSMDNSITDEVLDNLQAVMNKWAWATYTSGIVYFAASVFLFIAGITSLKFKKSTRTLSFVYAILTFGCVAFSVWLMFGTEMLKEQTEASLMGETDQSMIDLQMNLGRGGSLVGSVVYLIYPVFLIIWFLRREITDQIKCHFS